MKKHHALIITLLCVGGAFGVYEVGKKIKANQAANADANSINSLGVDLTGMSSGGGGGVTTSYNEPVLSTNSGNTTGATVSSGGGATATAGSGNWGGSTVNGHCIAMADGSSSCGPISHNPNPNPIKWLTSL